MADDPDKPPDQEPPKFWRPQRNPDGSWSTIRFLPPTNRPFPPPALDAARAELATNVIRPVIKQLVENGTVPVPLDFEVTFPDRLDTPAAQVIDAAAKEEIRRELAEYEHGLQRFLTAAGLPALPPLSPEAARAVQGMASTTLRWDASPRTRMWSTRFNPDPRKRLQEAVTLANLYLANQEKGLREVQKEHNLNPFDGKVAKRLRDVQDAYDEMMVSVMNAERELAEYDQAHKSH